jgi:DNA polymerase-3 subunit delta
LDLRLKAFQAAKKRGFVFEFPSLRDREVSGWLVSEAKRRGVAFSANAADLLSELAGPDLGRLSQALEQLTLYVGERKTIGPDDVEELVSETRQRSVFELSRAIGEGNTERATRMLHRMLANREPALRIQFMLIRQLRQMWKAKELLAQQVGRGEIASAIGVPPFALDEILAPARQLSVRALARAFERFYRNDRAMKSSRVDADLLLSRAVERLCDDIRGGASSRMRA